MQTKRRSGIIHTVSRRLRPLPSLAALAIVVVIGSVAVAGEPAAHAASSVTKSQALTFANDVNLTATDLPGSAVLAPAGEEGPRPNDVAFAQCSGGVGPSVALLDRKSPKFRVAGSELGSSAVVYPTSALAARNFDATRSRRGQACLRRLLTEDLNKQSTNGARYSATAVTSLPALLRGRQQSLGVRVAITVSAAGRETRAFVDVNDVLVGPAEVNLTTTRAEQPPSSATEHRLFGLLYARAQYHAL